jgi:hypothetical protein
MNIPFSREVKRLKLEAGIATVNLNESIFDALYTIGIGSLILGIIITFIGLWISSRANLGAPLLAGYFSKERIDKTSIWNTLFSSIFYSYNNGLIPIGII